MKRSAQGFRRSERLEAKRQKKDAETPIWITQTNEEDPIDFSFFGAPTPIREVEDTPIDDETVGDIPIDAEPDEGNTTNVETTTNMAMDEYDEVIETEPILPEQSPIEIIYTFYEFEEKVFFTHKPSILRAGVDVALLASISRMEPLDELFYYDKNTVKFVQLSIQILKQLNNNYNTLTESFLNNWITDIMEVFNNQLEYFPLLYWMIIDLFKSWNMVLADDLESQITIQNKFPLPHLFFFRLDTEQRKHLLDVRCNMVTNVIFATIAEELRNDEELTEPILKITNDFMMSKNIPTAYLEDFIKFMEEYVQQFVDHPVAISYTPYNPPGT